MVPSAPDSKLAAICGLFCGSCSVYIGSTEEPSRLERVAKRMGKNVDEMKCYGCRSEVLSSHCRACNLSKCAKEKGLEYCHECDQYPCDQLKTFQLQMPHRNDLFESGALLKEAGIDAWWTKMVEDYSCTQCHSINSAYDLTCRSCNHHPGSPYAGRHEASIRLALTRKS